MATYVPQKVGLPEAFVKQFIISSFIETLTWWLHQRQPITEGELLAYYLQMIGCCQHK
ncbi:TetR family transcriptional regulator [Streptococcus canis FSL Z3-227]|nr:TetR family transcriptional regulator [Streptococcus canis FSL Z3-227]